MKTITMFRPCNQKEMDLVVECGYKKWPPRLPDQDIFYPVTTQAYAHEINAWNIKQFGTGYVTRFEVKEEFVKRYKIHAVGGKTRTEWWIPVGDLEELNNNIVGLIEVLPNKKL